jgi:hypothetical protein
MGFAVFTASMPSASTGRQSRSRMRAAVAALTLDPRGS